LEAVGALLSPAKAAQLHVDTLVLSSAAWRRRPLRD